MGPKQVQGDRTWSQTGQNIGPKLVKPNLSNLEQIYDARIVAPFRYRGVPHIDPILGYVGLCTSWVRETTSENCNIWGAYGSRVCTLQLYLSNAKAHEIFPVSLHFPKTNLLKVMHFAKTRVLYKQERSFDLVCTWGRVHIYAAPAALLVHTLLKQQPLNMGKNTHTQQPSTTFPLPLNPNLIPPPRPQKNSPLSQPPHPDTTQYLYTPPTCCCC